MQNDGQMFNINGEYFIQINQLYKEFNHNIEQLSTSVVNFWKDFERESINVEKLQIEGIAIAKNIQSTFRVFSDLDNIKLFKDYQMYFQFAIVQLHILNDQIAYELYVNKMKSILETNKMFEKNFSSERDSDYSNFIISDANGQKFGQILQMNNSLKHLLGWTEEDYTKYRIESFMPTLIKEKHSAFLERYDKTGQSFIINNKTCMFVKKSNGYVIPIELFIKFHYSIEYQYVYLAILKPFYEMAPFSNGVRYNTDQLLFVITDGDDGRIFEYSESCKSILKFNKQYTNDGIIKIVDELIENFSFKIFTQTRSHRYITAEIYEEIHYLDLTYLSDVTEQDIDKGLQNLNNTLFDKFTKAKTRVFEERYSGGVLDLNIFCFLLLHENDDNTLSRNFNIEQTIMNTAVQNLQKDLSHKNQTQSSHIESAHDSSSITGSSFSQKSSTTSMLDYRNFHSFSAQKTPRSLKIIIQLIFILYLVMIVISSVNLGINITRQKQSEYDVHVIKDANDRMNLVSINLLISRVLLNIANGYEPEISSLMEDRFKNYKEIQREKIQLLREAQSSLQQSSFVNSDELSYELNENSMKLYYLNEQNLRYDKQENINIAFNLYIARVADMNSMTKEQMKGNQDIQTLYPSTDPTYKPNIYEQTLFFTIENGNKGF
ncbi:UNKNOWN [Stylonychia lemnae]|uniref:Pas domain s-box family protein n=1 Tax=Stylonychia lemnae TaxID=5949 RepID=A0A077ZT99_STYLE|nr:UNKNOWN [Stylonychia lemnae]|eukprot:CDW72555.1 UNKNOWN [Stylonychia lemnae]